MHVWDRLGLIYREFDEYRYRYSTYLLDMFERPQLLLVQNMDTFKPTFGGLRTWVLLNTRVSNI